MSRATSKSSCNCCLAFCSEINFPRHLQAHGERSQSLVKVVVKFPRETTTFSLLRVNQHAAELQALLLRTPPLLLSPRSPSLLEQKVTTQESQHKDDEKNADNSPFVPLPHGLLAV